MKTVGVCCAFLLFLAGCSSPTLKITRVKTPAPPSASETLAGVPFYVKTAACKHQTVWIQPVYALTLSVKVTADESVNSAKDIESSQSEDKSSAVSQRAHSATSRSSSSGPQANAEKIKTKTTASTCVYTKLVPLSVYNSKEQSIQKLQALLSQAGPPSTADLERIKNIFKAWDAITPGTYDPLSLNDDDTVASADVYLASNTITPEVYVDYTTTYYFNTRKPLAGSSQATAKLADDGTLTEGTGQVETKTLATFLSLIPVSDVLKTIATGALPFAAEQAAVQCLSPAAIKATYDFDLKFDTKTYKRTHSAFVSDKDSVLVKPPCSLPTTEVNKKTYSAYNATLEEVSAGSDNKNADNTVKVSGTVTLPKSAPAKGQGKAE